MVRMIRNVMGGQIYHVMSRATNRKTIFTTPKEYQEFLLLLQLAQKQFPVAVYAFALMPNHVHLLLSPKGDMDLSRFMHWLLTTHASIFRTHTETIGEGHVYQGRYKSFLIQNDEHYFTVLKYVEQNALRAGLVSRAEDWEWGSAWFRVYAPKKDIISKSFLDLPEYYRDWINDAQEEKTLEHLRASVNKSLPFGSGEWKEQVYSVLGISPPRPKGRPRKTQ